MNYISNYLDYVDYRFIGCHTFRYDHVTLKKDIGKFTIGEYFEEVLLELENMRISFYLTKDSIPVVYKINIPLITVTKLN